MIIWIASYPKSGNTWIRSLLSSYLFSNDGKFSFKLLENIQQFSSKNLPANTSSDTHYQARISENWIPSQKIINQDKKIHLLKTHNALCSINGNSFTDKFNTSGVIYIVRDPRNLVTSLSHHYELTLNEAFNFLTNKKKIIFPLNNNLEKNKNNEREDFNFLSDWKTHYKSWKNIKFCPVKVIRYEDFLINSEKMFIEILNFLSQFIKIEFDKKKIANSLNTTSFKNLAKLEDKTGFGESATSSKTNKKIKFFNLGKKNNWKKMLDKNTTNKIESSFKSDMIELGYL